MHDNKSLRIINSRASQDLPAGEFSSWLEHFRNAQLDQSGTDVPCGKCNACCQASYFIHIAPEETSTLAQIPKALLFPVPGLPKGNMLLGYDESGRCPMLKKDKCSIYEHRPQTCRNYDCRIFPAVGLVPDDRDKAQIISQVQRWKFSFPKKRDRIQHAAVQSAARFLRDYADYFPEGALPGNLTQLAVLAIKVYPVFLDINNKFGKPENIAPEQEIVSAVINAMATFHAI